MVWRNSLLRAHVAEHTQLLLVVSAHGFFLPALPVEARFFSVPDSASSLRITIQSMRCLSALLIAVLTMFGSGFAQSKPQSEVTVPGKDALEPIEENGRWGFVNAAGKLVITPKYFAAKPFKEGYAMVVTRSRGRRSETNTASFALRKSHGLTELAVRYAVPFPFGVFEFFRGTCRRCARRSHENKRRLRQGRLYRYAWAVGD